APGSSQTRLPSGRTRDSRRFRPTRPFSPRSFPASRRARRSTTLVTVKKRLDVLLVERGLAESRAQAQALVLAGRVRGYAKPGISVEDSAELLVARPARFVSRGGEKLAHALEVLGVDVAGKACL